MEPVDMEMDITQQHSADPLPFARSYQLEAFEKAIEQNTITYLETGSGKTLIAIMLLRSYAYLIRKPSPFYAVFLVPQVVLVKQQADAVEMHTDLNVSKYWGDMDVDFWDGAKWKQEIEKYEVLVMTPQILLNGLRHSFFKINMIKVLIIDECHHARGKHPYASIMTEFYHRQLQAGVSNLPRIFGMTASPIKSKGAKSVDGYWQKIHELETIMNSKVYTCVSESVVAQFVPFSTPKFKFYQHMEMPYVLYAGLAKELNVLKEKHECSVVNLGLEASAAESTRKKISKTHSALIHCLDELGVWLALKAAEYLSCYESDFLMWWKLNVFCEKIVRSYSLDAFHAFETCIPSVPDWTNVKASVDAGLLTTKVFCLIESLFEYRVLKDIRCIIFVERVITAIVLQSLFSELLPKHNSWKTKYIAGNNSGLQNQTRKKQNEIVEEFRKGMVNIVVATSILEEGLDVQSCNLVIRFDPSATVCSFIQSRGRARMQNSDFLLMVKSGDFSTHSRLENYLASGDVMRKESLCRASHPCSPLRNDLYDEEFYQVASTGACMTLSSSVGLIYFYCSRLPADGYFKPSPRCVIDKEMGICALHLPKSSPIQTVCVQGNIKNIKQKACFEACKQLHEIGALTDNLVPDIVVEENDAEETGREPYNDDQPIFFPPELVNKCSQEFMTKYYCYLMELKQNFDYEVPVHNIMLLVRSQLEMDEKSVGIELEVDRGVLTVNLKYVGLIHLNYDQQVILCRRFQIALFRVLIDRKADKLAEVLSDLRSGNNSEIDYLLLPSNYLGQNPVIDWSSVSSVSFSYEKFWKEHVNCNAGMIQTKSGLLCTCLIQNSLVCTPHNGHAYIINGCLNNLNANSLLRLSDESVMTYKEYYEQRHGIQLRFSRVPFLAGRHVFTVHNYLHRCRRQKEKESSNASVELPPELCDVIMSPISISTVYSFTFAPSIMYRLESLLLATNLKKMHLDNCVQNIAIPTMKVLEAITTKRCQENFHLESLETLGDSLLKYAVCQQLFKKHQNHHEGLLSIRKDKIISNTALCMLGCDKKLPGFVRDEPFDPKSWMIPGYNSGSYTLNEETLCNTRKIYVSGRRKVKSKKVADVVEALIGAYLSTGGEAAGVLFMNWIGITIDFMNIPYERHFKVQAEKYVNVRHLESLLNYSFQDPSLLVEALTHGSYMLAEIPGCYQRLEFLGDSVLDYLITLHLYNKYPGISPGLLTDLRSASVNNNCYALSAVKAGLHKHILQSSQKLYKHIKETVESFKELLLEYTFGWESEKSFPKVLGDVMESLAGAIFVDSGYNKETVFQSIRPLLEPMVTPESTRVHPVKELNELCQKEHFELRKPIVSSDNGASSITIEVEANGTVFKHTSTASDKKMAKKLASKSFEVPKGSQF
ncbi:endoribonuclease Dicer homolog 2-like isoform X2 [Durio zibethinus]|uniref:Endoribonuclease Dicer homolog 2-like isoform X2 n=1 Tax=Durio zibethinus TaxID=66656 RepID=A0A6P6BG10_DURZI|nr:endoribonuclease Dicer homolog 2-like isoform X2 [Durio zibethinus]